MRRWMIVVLAMASVLIGVLLVATWQLSRPKFDERLRADPIEALEIAPIDSALTFARVDSADGPRVVLVTQADADGLTGVDLEVATGQVFADGVEAHAALGHDALAQIAATAATTRIAIGDLSVPLDLADRHIAAGTNFRAHAEEVGRDEGPFLFPKLSRATAWNAVVRDRGRLDYEAEICAVTLSPHTAARPAPLGFLLCNDFTDRWALVKGMDLGEPMGTTGFPDGKGGEGMLPVGPFLVIPRDAQGFWRDLSLELYLNGDLRQRALGGQMIWSPAGIVSRALDGCDVAYHSRSGVTGLTDCAGIPPRTLILTGTPGGVMFHGLTLWSASAYLEPGDEVITVARHLGVLRNWIRD